MTALTGPVTQPLTGRDLLQLSIALALVITVMSFSPKWGGMLLLVIVLAMLLTASRRNLI